MRETVTSLKRGCTIRENFIIRDKRTRRVKGERKLPTVEKDTPKKNRAIRQRVTKTI